MDSDKKEVTLWDLEQRLEEALKTIDEDYGLKDKAKRRKLSYEEARQEALDEIIEGIVPIYNYDLLTVCGSSLDLGYYETDGEYTNIYDILREAIYTHLQDYVSGLN